MDFKRFWAMLLMLQRVECLKKTTLELFDSDNAESNSVKLDRLCHPFKSELFDLNCFLSHTWAAIFFAHAASGEH